MNQRHYHLSLWMRMGVTLPLLGTALMLMLSGCALLTQSSPRTARLVYFGPGNVSPGDNYAAFRDDLQKAGWVEGQNFTFDWRVQIDTTGIEAWMPELEADVIRGRQVVLTTDSTAHALALKKATSSVPIVVGIGDPVAIGLVSNYAHPGANITGTSTSPFAQTGKRIEMLKEVLPSLAHLGVLYAEPANPNLAPELAEFEIATRQLGMDMVVVRARRIEEFDAAFEALGRADVAALFVVQDVMTLDYVAEVAAFATQRGFPTMCARNDWVQRGCLMSYAANRAALQAMRVGYIDRVLRGARPGDLPIQLPTVFDLSINVNTLHALGLTISPLAVPLVTQWVQ